MGEKQDSVPASGAGAPGSDSEFAGENVRETADFVQHDAGTNLRRVAGDGERPADSVKDYAGRLRHDAR